MPTRLWISNVGPRPALQGQLNPVLKSGLISGGLSLAGDVLAQLLTNKQARAVV
jgi:hypothetical protein